MTQIAFRVRVVAGTVARVAPLANPHRTKISTIQQLLLTTQQLSTNVVLVSEEVIRDEQGMLK